ncbi:MAG TPA: hypothetical protein VFW57_03865 [Acidimicrobiia bacterium]|nr:hypothetical protein [Acidimicrobiia bacterium]
MNTKVLLLAMVGGLLLPVLPLVVGLIAGLGEWPSHALPRTTARPESTESPAEKVAA